MVQRKVPSKLGNGIQADHVKSDKHLANLKLSSSQLQDGKTRGADMKKKMKKPRSIKLSDLKAIQPSPQKKSISQPGRPPPPLQVPTTARSPQKQQPLVKTSDESPNYMKPTSSSCAKKELFPVSLRNTQMDSDFKSQRPKSLSNLKTGSVSGKKPVKTLSRSSSLKLVRTLTKTTSFKPSRACPRKSSRVALCADMDAHKATCSSTLKDSKFPTYLMLNPGGTESEGTSVIKVCPYTYCSLNGHHHAPLPPLKSFLSARRRVFKTQKCLKLEALSPRRLKVPRETKKECEIEQNVFDGKPAYQEADTANSIVTPLVQEIGMDYFIEIYAKEKEVEAKPTGEPDGYKRVEICSAQELKNQEDIRSTIEDDSVAVRGDDDITQLVARVSDGSPKSEIDFEEDFKKYYDDVAVEAEKNESILQEQKSEHAHGDSSPNWPNDEVSIGSCYSEVSYEEEHLDDIEMDHSDSEVTDMDWEERQFYGSEHEDDAVSSVFTEVGADSKVDCSSESSHDVSVLWLDDILCNYYEDIMADKVLQDPSAEESTCFEEQPQGADSDLEGTRESTGELFQDLTNAEENSGENEAYVDIGASPSSSIEETIEEPKESSEEIQEKDDVLQTEILMAKTSVEPGDDETNCITPVLDEALDNRQEDMSLQEDATGNSDVAKLLVESYGNDFSQDPSGADTVDNAQDHKMSEACVSNDGSISQETDAQLSPVHSESTVIVQDQELLENDKGKAKKLQTSSCMDVEDKNTSRIWKGARHNRLEDDEEMRKFNPREPNFLPLVPDPEAEKVDLKHQMMDERKNSEEWMLDYALRQTVNKLAPARKRKVALLVEAFEKVMPPPNYETDIRNHSSLTHARPMQACS
ncbi:hypothetical protein L6164_017884 [Bauhinia variegata]|uniref:Uncharacterized protein n=1 Tax=Bauhinia variegata TaxID=167791 RepID=A0ACB9N991_BAUVA|nr:hypothetical protein L6164_017884 [Bauhinia variegata]